MDVNFFAINLSSGLEQFGTVASRKDFLSKWHLLLEKAILVLFDMGPFNTFYYCCCYRTEKWICSKIAQRKI